MKPFKALTFTILLSVSSPVVLGESTESDHAGVWVFSARSLPPITGQHHASRVFYVDGADAALKQLQFANPRNSELAKSQAIALLQTTRGQAVIEQLSQVGEGIALAWQHGIEKLPAVLVDGTHVVYGVFDVVAAVRLIEERKNP